MIDGSTPAARFRVSWPSELEGELAPVREALATFPTGGSGEPDVCFSVEHHVGSGRERYTLLESDGGVRHCLDVNQVVSALVGRLNSRHLQHASDLVNLHAAGLSAGGRGVIVTGPSGSGKSTLALAAVSAGFEYLSDETVGIDAAGRMRWYPKPVTVKGDGWTYVAELTHQRPPEVEWASGRRWELPVTGMRADAVRADADPALVLCVTHDAEAPLRSRQLEPVEVLGSLVANSSDLARFGPGGVHRLARVAARAGGLELTYGDATGVVPVIEELLVSDRPEVAVEELDASPSAVALGAGLLGPETRPARLAPSVVLGQVAVVHRPRFDRLYTLDPVATHAWRLLGGRTPVATVEEAVSGSTGAPRTTVRGLIDDLAALGLLGELPVPGGRRPTEPRER